MWIEAIFTIEQDSVEAWSDALIDAGATSVQIDDADAQTPQERALFGEPGASPGPIGWNRSRVAAMLDFAQSDSTSPARVALPCVATALGSGGDSVDGAARRAAITLVEAAAAAIGKSPPADVTARQILERDWVADTQSQFAPIDVGARLRVTPSWHASERAAGQPDADGRIEVVLDPGLAFGTGGHPTTLMCLQWIESSMRRGSSVIDYGCGSGLLAIAAARLGAAHVVGVDIDPQALRAARANASINGVAVDVRSTHGARPAPSDVVIANILASPLIVLAPLLEDLVQPGGTLVLAGLLERQVGEVTAAYRSIQLSVYRTEEGWACLSGLKRA